MALEERPRRGVVPNRQTMGGGADPVPIGTASPDALATGGAPVGGAGAAVAGQAQRGNRGGNGITVPAGQAGETYGRQGQLIGGAGSLGAGKKQQGDAESDRRQRRGVTGAFPS